MASVLDQSARSLVAAVADRRIAAADVIEALADRLTDDPYNAFLALDLDGALASALEMDGQSSHGEKSCETSGLRGLPLPLKDLEPTAHLPTTYGSPVVSAGQAADGVFSYRAKARGALAYGKTNTPAFGHKDTTDNLLMEPALNPWDRTLTAGGSSGGAAVVVASGLGPVAHATDAAGSARIPAALCGVVGFKPTRGVIPRLPSADYWSAKAHHGLIGRTVDDVRLVLEKVAGSDPRDPLSSELGRSSYQNPPRVAYVTSFFGLPVGREVASTVETALGLFERAGIEISRPSHEIWPDPVSLNRKVTAAQFHRRFARRLESAPELFDSTLARLVREGENTTADDLLAATEQRSRLYDLAARFFADFDFVLFPTLPVTAWSVDTTYPLIDGVPFERPPGARWSDLLLANLLGWPAITIPCGLAERLPVGLHMMSRMHSDLACLDFAETLERHLDFKPPPLTGLRADER